MIIYIFEFSLGLTHFYKKWSTLLDILVNQQVSILAVLNCIIILNCGYMYFIICETFFMCFIAKRNSMGIWMEKIFHRRNFGGMFPK